jgi:8-oxo-dGTP diphosphatase
MREYPERPIVGVGAVVLDGDRVLLVRRGHEPLKGEWSLPGGAVEVGEALDAAVAREVLEETGVEVEVGPMIDVLDSIRVDPDGRARYHFVLIDYLCRPIGGTLCCATDAADATWAAVDDLARFALVGATLTMIEKALEITRAGPPFQGGRRRPA